MRVQVYDLEGQGLVQVEAATAPRCGEDAALLARERAQVQGRQPWTLLVARVAGTAALFAVACVAIVAVLHAKHIIGSGHFAAAAQPLKPQQKQLLVYPVSQQAPVASGADVDAWERVLQAHVAPAVREGITTHQVDYAGVAANADFQLFIQSLQGVNIASLDKEAYYATLMNAYNALAIKMVIDNACQPAPAGQCSPLVSIGDIAKGAGGPWSKPIGNIGGTMYSLQQIEDMLRKPSRFPADARLHACITCASISCPNLAMEAFRVEAVDSQMAARMQSLLGNQQKGYRLDETTMSVTLSKVFEWYKADFEQAVGGSVIDFILPYVAAQDERAFLMANKQAIAVAPFPWDRNLNGDAPCNCQSGYEAANQRFA